MPGQTATVFVALAVTGGIPVKRSGGKVMKLPPPAIELATPATRAADVKRAISEELTRQCKQKLLLNYPVTRFHKNNGQQQGQSNRIGQDDRHGPEPQSIYQPTQYARGECQQHAP